MKAAIELATSEILPSHAATAPRNYARRFLRTLRVGGRWPRQHHCSSTLDDNLLAAVLLVLNQLPLACVMFAHLDGRQGNAEVRPERRSRRRRQSRGEASLRPALAPPTALCFWPKSDKPSRQEAAKQPVGCGRNTAPSAVFIASDLHRQPRFTRRLCQGLVRKQTPGVKRFPTSAYGMQRQG